MQIAAAYSPWQKGRDEQRIATIKEVAGKTNLQHQVAERSAMSVVSYEVAHTPNQRAGRLGTLPTRVLGQRMVHGELVDTGRSFPIPKVADEGDELARRFIFRASAREALEEHAASSNLCDCDEEEMKKDAVTRHFFVGRVPLSGLSGGIFLEFFLTGCQLLPRLQRF